MKVYIAKRHYDYEGFDIIGVFRIKEDAEKLCKKDSKELNGCDWHTADEHELLGCEQTNK